MKKYEIMFIVKPNLEEATIKQVAADMKKILEEKKAKVLEEKEFGKKELAYEIDKFKTGFYFLLILEAKDSKPIEEFDRLALLSEDIIRHLIIKIEE